MSDDSTLAFAALLGSAPAAVADMLAPAALLSFAARAAVLSPPDR